MRILALDHRPRFLRLVRPRLDLVQDAAAGIRISGARVRLHELLWEEEQAMQVVIRKACTCPMRAYMGHRMSVAAVRAPPPS